MNAHCFVNGKVWTLDARSPVAEAVVTKGKLIAFVGSSAEAERRSGTGARRIDLGGRLVLPGFIDGHTHLLQGGFHLQGIDLRDVKSSSEFTEKIGSYVTSHPGTWVTGGDWDEQAWKKPQLPRRQWIDTVTGATPVFVQRLDGHMALANSAALQRAGISGRTPDPPGGVIEREPGTGEPTGILKDAAMNLVTEVIPPPTEEDMARALDIAMRHASRFGVTTVHDITLPEHLPLFQKFEEERRLTVRIYTRLPIAGVDGLIAHNIHHAHGTDLLKLGSLKAFADGSLGSGTALFFEPYLDDPTHAGLAMDIVTDGRLRRWAFDADRQKLQLSIHAIGDRAIDTILSLFEDIVAQNPPWDRRHRIEHAQHVRRPDLERFRRLGVIVSAQPYHCVDDGVWAEKRIGHERAQTTYAFRSFMEAGVTVCFGSDWTVAPLDPIAGIHAAVTRRTADGAHPGGWIPGERVGVEDAVRAYTLNGAYAAYEERTKGSIEVGKLADLVVLSRDIFTLEPERIREAEVDMTMFDGRVVYER